MILYLGTAANLIFDIFSCFNSPREWRQNHLILVRLKIDPREILLQCLLQAFCGNLILDPHSHYLQIYHQGILTLSVPLLILVTQEIARKGNNNILIYLVVMNIFISMEQRILIHDI